MQNLLFPLSVENTKNMSEKAFAEDGRMPRRIGLSLNIAQPNLLTFLIILQILLVDIRWI